MHIPKEKFTEPGEKLQILSRKLFLTDFNLTIRVVSCEKVIREWKKVEEKTIIHTKRDLFIFTYRHW